MTYATPVIVVYVDGSPKGHLCYIIGTDKPDFVEIPTGITHNECEYKALIAALKDPRITLCSTVDIYSDSMVVVEQMARALGLRKGWRCNFDHLRAMIKPAVRIIRGKHLIFNIKHVPREENLAGIALDEYLKSLNKVRIGVVMDEPVVHKDGTEWSEDRVLGESR